MIHCHALTKRYRDHLVLDALDLTIDPGICALLGANGAGKSTLLKLMTGQLAPDLGAITINGLNVTTQAPAVMQHIGVLPEELGLFETLTILENLQLTGPIYGLSPTETSHRAADLLTTLGLDTTQHRFVRDCSYGMRKKTSLALALLHNPTVLFLDEPFEGIDPSSSRVIQTVLRSAAARGLTIVLTSHILPLIEQLADRILILANATIAYDSQTTITPAPLEANYFELVGQPTHEALSWLGS
jgi:ABC-2 type transport system ATP-binding protein